MSGSILAPLWAGDPVPQPEPARSGPAMQEEKMRTEPFSFVRNGGTLRGLIDYPVGRRPTAGIVLLSGHGATNVAGGRAFIELRGRFTAAGLACCAWDRPGCGGSDGEFDLNQTVKDSGEEAALAVDAFSKQAGLKPDRIGLWGISRGTGIGQSTLEQRPTLAFWIAVSPPSDHDNSPYLLETNLRLEGRTEAQIRSLMAESRAASRILRTGGTFEAYLAAMPGLREDPFKKLLAQAGFDNCSDNEKCRVQFAKEQARWRNGDYAECTVDEKTETLCWPASDSLARIHCPALIVFGEKDSVVDWRESARFYREAFAANGNKKAVILTFPDGNHSINRCKTGSVREMVTDRQTSVCDGYYASMLTWLHKHGFASPSHE